MVTDLMSGLQKFGFCTVKNHVFAYIRPKKQSISGVTIHHVFKARWSVIMYLPGTSAIDLCFMHTCSNLETQALELRGLLAHSTDLKGGDVVNCMRSYY